MQLHIGYKGLHHCLVSTQHAQQLEARLAQRLHEAAQRRVSHLDQIRERAAISKEDRDTCPPMSPKHHKGTALQHPRDLLLSFKAPCCTRVIGWRAAAADLKPDRLCSVSATEQTLCLVIHVPPCM